MITEAEFVELAQRIMREGGNAGVHPLQHDLACVLTALDRAKQDLVGLGIRDLVWERDPQSDALLVRFRLLAPEAVKCVDPSCEYHQ